MKVSADRLLGAFDLAATLIFAVEGARAAVLADLDVFGVLVIAFASSLGGGITRDVLIGDVPPASLRSVRYPATAFGAGMLVIAAYHFSDVALTGWGLTAVDAAGLGLFAVTGAAKALDHGMNWLLAVLLVGPSPPWPGGTIRDVLLNEVPAVLRADIYAVAAIFGAAVNGGGPNDWVCRGQRPWPSAGWRVSGCAWSASTGTGTCPASIRADGAGTAKPAVGGGGRSSRGQLPSTLMDDEFLLFAGSASQRLGRSIAEYLDCPLGASETLPLLRGQPLRPGAGERARPRRLPRAGHGLPGQRQLHGAAVLDRRPQAGQRRVGDRRHPVLQLRQGRQEGRAAGVDPGPRLRRRDRGGRRRPGRDHGPARAADPGVLPASRSTTSTRCRCCATPSAPRASRPRRRRPRRRLRQEGPAVGRTGCGVPLAIADKRRVDHTRVAPRSSSSSARSRAARR